MSNNNLKKDAKAGRVIGAILFVLGAILTAILLYLIGSAKSLPRFLIAGPSIIGLGVAMFVFPGGTISYKEINSAGSKKGLHRLWFEASILDRFFWIIGGVIGLIISFKIMFNGGFLASF